MPCLHMVVYETPPYENQDGINNMKISRGYIIKAKYLFGLSRTPHALLDMTAPALVAVTWLGGFPPLYIILMGLLTVFSGYTAVYALNDVMDYGWDKEKVKDKSYISRDDDLDSLIARHPLAQGMLSLRESYVWVFMWTGMAIIGAYILNPVCLLIFLCAFLLETVYCVLWKVTCMKTVVSGAVKSAGSLAAVFAVEPHPSILFIIVLFFWFFFWEIGGQNVPNDWADINEDLRLNARTVPVCVGARGAKFIIITSITVSILLSVLLLTLSPFRSNIPVITAWLLTGFYFVIIPSLKLFRSENREDALALFNRSSYYHITLLAVTTIGITIRMFKG
jgi:4-hydroxybenzoate polyprenyltransferase